MIHHIPEEISMNFSRRMCLSALCLAAAFPVAGVAQAGDFPQRPITIVVPTAPGGGNDAMARILAQRMGEELKQTIVVENKPGANGAIASMHVARAKPDGYTLLFGYIATHAISPAMQKLNYDPVKDFAPIGDVASSPTLLVVNNDLPVKSVDELIAYAKDPANQVNYASAGNGTAPHAAGALFNMATGAKMMAIPYKGSNPAMMDTISGTTQVMFPSLFSAAPHIRSGNVKGLAVAGERRTDVFKDLPTLKELGVDVSVDQWYAIFAPAGTPPEIVQVLNKALNTSLNDPEVTEKFTAQGAFVQTSTPEGLGQRVEQDLEKWKSVVKHMGLDAEQ